jgi:Pregnancy-associated plasma protein-A
MWHVSKYSLLTLLLFSAITVAAQQKVHWCGTVLRPEQKQAQLLRGIPGLSECHVINKIERTLQISLHIALNKSGSNGVDQADIDDAVVRLNQDFAPCGLQFQICEQEEMPDDRFDSLSVFDYYNEEVQMSAIHYEPNTINLYLVDTIGSPLGDIAGYAYFPGGPDMIVIEKSSFNGDSDVQTHEMGHFFGLYHTFETEFGAELANMSNCDIAGDFVCDTEADPDQNGNVDVDDQCNYSGPVTQDSNGDWYVPPTDNFMSYYDVDCTCRFTPQQYIRMLDQYATLRFYLW